MCSLSTFQHDYHLYTPHRDIYTTLLRYTPHRHIHHSNTHHTDTYITQAHTSWRHTHATHAHIILIYEPGRHYTHSTNTHYADTHTMWRYIPHMHISNTHHTYTYHMNELPTLMQTPDEPSLPIFFTALLYHGCHEIFFK